MIGGKVVVDASVVVEYLVQLQWPVAARRLFRAMGNGSVELLAPDLLFLETTSALRRLAMTKAIEPRAAKRAMTLLSHLPIRSMGTQQLLEQVWDWRENLTPYDAAYAVLAKRVEATLVTADEALASSCRRQKIEALTLRELGE